MLIYKCAKCPVFLFYFFFLCAKSLGWIKSWLIRKKQKRTLPDKHKVYENVWCLERHEVSSPSEAHFNIPTAVRSVFLGMKYCGAEGGVPFSAPNRPESIHQPCTSLKMCILEQGKHWISSAGGILGPGLKSPGVPNTKTFPENTGVVRIFSFSRNAGLVRISGARGLSTSFLDLCLVSANMDWKEWSAPICARGHDPYHHAWQAEECRRGWVNITKPSLPIRALIQDKNN